MRHLLRGDCTGLFLFEKASENHREQRRQEQDDGNDHDGCRHRPGKENGRIASGDDKALSQRLFGQLPFGSSKHISSRSIRLSAGIVPTSSRLPVNRQTTDTVGIFRYLK